MKIIAPCTGFEPWSLHSATMPSRWALGAELPSRIHTIIRHKYVDVRKLQVAIIVRSPREMSQTDRILPRYILSRAYRSNSVVYLPQRGDRLRRTGRLWFAVFSRIKNSRPSWDSNSWQGVPREDTISLRHLPRRSNKNCDLPFANVDRLMANYSIDTAELDYL